LQVVEIDKYTVLTIGNVIRVEAGSGIYQLVRYHPEFQGWVLSLQIENIWVDRIIQCHGLAIPLIGKANQIYIGTFWMPSADNERAYIAKLVKANKVALNQAIAKRFKEEMDSTAWEEWAFLEGLKS
jgi:hypothetical protein